MTPSSPISHRTPTPTVLMRRAPFADRRGSGQRNASEASTKTENLDMTQKGFPPVQETEVASAEDVASDQDLRSRLKRMSFRLSEQERRHTLEISRLRKENTRLLSEATRSAREKDESLVKAQRYKKVARRMKEKLMAMNHTITRLQRSSDTNMGAATQQTKSLLERLFLSDVRRRDLEARFGTLARPSTNLKQKLTRPDRSVMNDLSICAEGPSSKSKYLPGANAPPSLVIAPQHLDDRSFTPNQAKPVKPSRPSLSSKVRLSSPAKRPHMARIMIPQFQSGKSLSERMEPLLKASELAQLRDLSNLEGVDGARD